MFRFSALLLTFSTIVYIGVLADESVVPDPDSRIVGGTSADIENVPYQLSVRWNNNHFCGATLISASWSVSAAHCTIGLAVGPMSLLAGTANRLSGGQVRAVEEVINHASYNPSTYDNDISLIKVATPFNLDLTVSPTGLPRYGASVAAGTYGMVSGWGHLSQGDNTSPTSLQQVSLPVVAQASCNTAYGGSVSRYMLCAGYMAGGRDACQGDSGGPFIVNGQLIGIISWGRGCAQSDYPGVYARVALYRTWIRRNTGI